MVFRSLPLNVYIGYDSRTPEASTVCEQSILENIEDMEGQFFHDSTRHNLKRELEVSVHFIDIKELAADGLFWRKSDGKESTEFTYTRFLTPYLCDYEGLSVFMDCDFMWRSNIFELLAEFCISINSEHF